MKEKLTKSVMITIIIAIIGLIFLTVFIIHNGIIYKNGYDFENDKTANVNVMLTRPDNWSHIESGQITLKDSDFALIDGSTATIPITAELARQFCDASDEEIQNLVNHNTTHTAYQNLIYTARQPDKAYSKKELIFVTEPSEDEKALADELLLNLKIQPIALDGFVFITHKDNPIDSLTVEQVQGIYSGEITNWKQIGGLDEEIIPYQRERNSGSQTAMEQLVMKDKKLMKPVVARNERDTEVFGMGMLIERVGEYQNRMNSIGYTYLYYIHNLYKSEDIKVLKIDGVYPDNENLINKSYPFTTAYYEVRTNRTSERLSALYDYLLSDEGQKIIALAGYCPVKGE